MCLKCYYGIICNTWTKCTLGRELFGVALYDQICEQAIGNYGLITTMDAEALGVRRKDLVEWVRLGRLTRIGHGVYRIEHYLPTEYDRYADAVAIVGRDAALWGESVLAMHNLAMVNPLCVRVATGRRVRKALPKWIELVKKPEGAEEDVFEGIRCQNLASVILECRGKLMTDRLLGAIDDASRRGLLRSGEVEMLNREFER